MLKSNQTKKNPLLNLFQLLTDPPPAITDLQQRRQAQLLASLLLIIIPLGSLSAIIQLLAVPDFLPTFTAIAAALIVLAIAYAFIRASFYYVAAIMTVLIPPTAAYASLLTNPGDNIALGFLLVGVLLSSILLNSWFTASMALLNLLGLLLLPTLQPAWGYALLAGSISYHLLFPALILIAMLHRKIVESDRQAELRKSEQRFSLLFAHTYDLQMLLSIRADRKTYIETVNQSYLDGMRRIQPDLTERDLIGRDWMEVQREVSHTTPEELEARNKLLQQVADTRAPARVEDVISSPAGYMHLDILITPVIETDGSCHQVFWSARDTTDRKRAEAAVQQANLVIENSPVVLFRWSLDVEKGWPVEFVTNNVSQFGYTAEEILSGKVTYTQMIHPEDLPRVIAEEEAYLAKGVGVWQTEYRLVAKDGRVVFVEDHTLVERDDQGQAIRTQGIIIDITKRQQGEQALRESEERFRTLVEQLPAITYSVAVMEYNKNSPTTFISPQVQTILGYTREEWLADPELWMKLLLDEEREQVVKDTLMARGLNMVYRSRTRDGRTIWLHNQNKWVHDVEGQPHAVHGVMFDITERKQAEEALQESELRFRSLFENSPIPLWEEDFSHIKRRIDELRQAGVTDFDEFFKQNPEVTVEMLSAVKVLDVNGAALKLHGAVSKEELLGNLSTVLGSESFAVFGAELTVVAAEQTEFEGEGVNYTLQGEKLNVHVRWTVMPGHEKDYAKLLMSVQDITERKRAEAALAEANAELEMALFKAHQLAIAAEEASRLKSQILANTSHELRTPLTGILGSLNVVLEGLCDTEEERLEFINTAYSAARNLLAVINDLLDLARIEAGRMELDLQPLAVSSILSEVYDLTHLQAEAKQLILEIPLVDQTLLTVRADSSKLRQIIMNLVGNAIKFTEHGTVAISTESRDGYGYIEIRDTGIGISHDKQARLFQPFVQGDGTTTRKYGGSGLGLSISRQLAELMEGTLTLYSAGEGLGSTFTIAMPLAEEF